MDTKIQYVRVHIVNLCLIYNIRSIHSLHRFMAHFLENKKNWRNFQSLIFGPIRYSRTFGTNCTESGTDGPKYKRT